MEQPLVINQPFSVVVMARAAGLAVLLWGSIRRLGHDKRAGRVAGWTRYGALSSGMGQHQNGILIKRCSPTPRRTGRRCRREVHSDSSFINIAEIWGVRPETWSWCALLAIGSNARRRLRRRSDLTLRRWRSQKGLSITDVYVQQQSDGCGTQALA